jgi:hypothetical protein
MRKRKFVVMIITIAMLFFIILLLCFRYCGNHNQSQQAENLLVSKIRNTLEKPASSAPTMSLDTMALQKTENIHKNRLTHVRKAIADTSGKSLQKSGPSTTPIGDTLNANALRCKNDTIAPWVYTDPAGGLHHTAISVKLFGTKPCAIEWKEDSAAEWRTYDGAPIPIEKNAILWLRASDSCGNRMAPREEQYEIAPEDSLTYCPSNMEHIFVGATSFCMDRYEWPNKKGMVPMAYVSVYQATDSCAASGKRLCASDEWTIACTGPYGWKYPYGAHYQLYACTTNDTTARPSGDKPECRGYFGVFDMSGNLAEWTSTKSAKNTAFNNVMGGFWESGPQSGCFDVRYSYFPQNRHNPVGFRCCADARPQPRLRQHGVN